MATTFTKNQYIRNWLKMFSSYTWTRGETNGSLADKIIAEIDNNPDFTFSYKYFKGNVHKGTRTSVSTESPIITRTGPYNSIYDNDTWTDGSNYKRLTDAKEAPIMPSFHIKVLGEYFNNIFTDQSKFGETLRINDKIVTSDAFFSYVEDCVIYKDFLNSGSTTPQKIPFIRFYDDNNLEIPSDTYTLGLRCTQNGYISTQIGTDATNIAPSDAYCFTGLGSGFFYSIINSGEYSLLDVEFAHHYLNSDFTTKPIPTTSGVCGTVSFEYDGTRYYTKCYKKEWIEDCLDTFYEGLWSYDGPLGADPKLTSLSIDDAILTPSFNSDITTYSIKNYNSFIKVRFTGNEDTTLYKVTIGIVTYNTYNNTIDLDYVLDKQFFTVEAYNEATGIGKTYTVNLNNYNPLPTEPGQVDNVTHNEGGTGTTFASTITKPSNPFIGAGIGTHTYALDVVQLLKLINSFNNPAIWQTLTELDMKQVVNINLWPIKVPHTYATARHGIYIGKSGVNYTGDTGHDVVYELTPIDGISLNFGELEIPEFFGGFIDYEPYTNIQIYLPYCGIQTIKANDVVGHKIHLLLVADQDKGTGQYLLGISYTDKNGDSAWVYKYKWPCQLATPISITSDNASQIQQSILKNVVNGIIGVGTTAIGKGGDIKDEVLNASSSFVTAGINSITATAPTMVGSAGDNCERFGPQMPYLIITRPITVVPTDYNKNYGRPSLIRKKLSKLKGFTTIPNPIININATLNEINEIKGLLQQGVNIK